MKRKCYVDKKRLNETTQGKNISAKTLNMKKELKKELTSLLDKDFNEIDNLSMNSDLSYDEYKNILKDDPTRNFYLSDI